MYSNGFQKSAKSQRAGPIKTGGQKEKYCDVWQTLYWKLKREELQSTESVKLSHLSSNRVAEDSEPATHQNGECEGKVLFQRLILFAFYTLI